ncbi:DUF5990 family protein [Streptomyces sp. NPDC046261]|uniref:DUF5990 family protein n=1 Tax=Streptomyces sp. NPDC046261 TaxID=3157200 RepID=UPI0033D9EDDC
MTAAGDDRTLRILLTLPAPPRDAGTTGDVGLQDKSGELLPGRVLPDATTRYEVDVKLRAAGAGKGAGGEALDFSGPFVHGTRGARFLYLSTRDPHGPGWARRCKIMLPGSAPADGHSLAATVTDTSTSRARLSADGWTVGKRPGG